MSKPIKYFLLFILIFFLIFILSTVFQVYERFYDTNKFIALGLQKSVNDSIIIEEKKGIIKSVISSYTLNEDGISSSYFYNNIDDIAVQIYQVQKCDKPLFFIKKDKFVDSIRVTNWVSYQNLELVYCSKNSYINNKRLLATWTIGQVINTNRTKNIIVYIFLFTFIFLIFSYLVLLNLLRKFEEAQKKIVTKNIINKIRHEIPRPIIANQKLLRNIKTKIPKNFNDIHQDLDLSLFFCESSILISNSILNYLEGCSEFPIKPQKAYCQVEKAIDNSEHLIRLSNDIKIRVIKEISDLVLSSRFLLDFSHLEIVFLNLFQNAINAVKFQNQAVFHIKVHVESKTDLIIYFKNYDSSFSHEQIKNIFSLRLTKDSLNSHGYGLLIVSDIIKAHDGIINLISNPEDNFVEYKIVFKNVDFLRWNNHSKKNELIGKNSEDNKFNTIAVIDDSILFLEKWQLAKLDTHVSTFRSLDEFVDTLDNNDVNDFNCIICDYDFGSFNLSQNNFISYLRDDLNYRGIIAISSYARVNIKELGADIFLDKRVYNLIEIKEIKNHPDKL